MIKLMKQRWWCKAKTALIFKHRDSRLEIEVPVGKSDDEHYLVCEINEQQMETVLSWLADKIVECTEICDDCYALQLANHYKGTLECTKCSTVIERNKTEESV